LVIVPRGNTEVDGSTVTGTKATAAPSTLDAAAGKDYAAFLRYAVGPGQEPGVAPGQLALGMAPLSNALKAQAPRARIPSTLWFGCRQQSAGRGSLANTPCRRFARSSSDNHTDHSVDRPTHIPFATNADPMPLAIRSRRPP
jgi:hypothetical protein